MPGLFGVVDTAAVLELRHRAELRDLAHRMAAAMDYDPEYCSRIIPMDALGACVGIVGRPLLSNSSAQAADNVVIVRTGLEQPDTPDSSTLLIGPAADEVLAAYRRGGTAELSGLGGMRAGFVADDHERRSLLFTDRYGRERIYFTLAGTRLFFASEAKAILAVVPDSRAFDPEGLAELLACGCTLGKRSLFRGIEVMPGGTAIGVDAGRFQHHRYFDPSSVEQVTPASPREFVDGFAASLAAAVNDHAAVSRVGVSLTGGLDSRMVMAAVNATPEALSCYTFGSMFRETGDVRVARRVAACCGYSHHVIELGRPFLEAAREYLNRAVYISDGYIGLSGAAELYLNERARRIAPSRLTGNWGSELMRGARAFKWTPPQGDCIAGSLMPHLNEAQARFANVSAHPVSAALFNQMPMQGYGRYAIERSQVAVRSPFLSDDVVRWLYRAPSEARAAMDTVKAVVGLKPPLLNLETDRGLLGNGSASWRQTWRRGLIKAEYMTSHGAPHFVARLSRSLPPSFLETAFLGVDKFQHFRHWMRHELSGLLRDTLVDNPPAEMKNWFDSSRARTIVLDHISGRGNYTDEIDKMLTVACASESLLRPAHVRPPEPHGPELTPQPSYGR
jgi:asparagine synthase (glutamine-hydrolysing)